jgi:hypothetical protein
MSLPSFDARGRYGAIDVERGVYTDTIRPKTYYDEGPYEVPSSESGDDGEPYKEGNIQQAGINEGDEVEGLLPRQRVDLLPRKQVSTTLPCLLC